MGSLAKQSDFPAQPDMPSQVYWGCHDSPLGPLLVGITDSGFCRLEFASGYGIAYDLSVWKKEWPETEFIADASMSAPIASQFREIEPGSLGTGAMALYGTEFQLKVWKALLQVPAGQSISFTDITQMLKKPLSPRAADLAKLSSTLVECHRVINENGSFGGYRYGAAEKPFSKR